MKEIKIEQKVKNSESQIEFRISFIKICGLNCTRLHRFINIAFFICEGNRIKIFWHLPLIDQISFPDQNYYFGVWDKVG